MKAGVKSFITISVSREGGDDCFITGVSDHSDVQSHVIDEIFLCLHITCFNND
jgi:hypothetical protein